MLWTFHLWPEHSCIRSLASLISRHLCVCLFFSSLPWKTEQWWSVCCVFTPIGLFVSNLISVKLGGRMRHGPRQKPLHCDTDPHKGLDPRECFFYSFYNIFHDVYSLALMMVSVVVPERSPSISPFLPEWPSCSRKVPARFLVLRHRLNTGCRGTCETWCHRCRTHQSSGNTWTKKTNWSESRTDG